MTAWTDVTKYLYLSPRGAKKCFVFLEEAAAHRCSWKKYSENMQQIYRGTPMSNCDFNKAAKEITLRHGFSPINFLDIFRALFTKNTYGRLLLFFIELELSRFNNFTDSVVLVVLEIAILIFMNRVGYCECKWYYVP